MNKSNNKFKVAHVGKNCSHIIVYKENATQSSYDSITKIDAAYHIAFPEIAFLNYNSLWALFFSMLLNVGEEPQGDEIKLEEKAYKLLHLHPLPDICNL